MDKHMVVLLVIMAITLYFSRLNDYLSNRKVCLGLVTLIMACFSGFRSWWMGDLIKYYTLYRQCNGANWLSNVLGDGTNMGIRLFFRGMGMIGLSYDVCIFVIALFSAVTLAIVVYKYSPSPYWSYLMYITMGIYLFTYSGLKQTIAMGFLMLAIIGIFENNIRKFLVWTLVGGVFHAPALIFLVAYPIAKKKVDIIYFLVLVISVVCIFSFRDQIVQWFVKAYYEEERMFNVTKDIGGRTLMMILMIILGAFLRPVRQGDSNYCKVFNLMIVAAIIQYFSIYNNIFTRLADYYYQFIVLFMPMILETGEHQKEMTPQLHYRIRYYNTKYYVLMSLAITVFALWFYNSTITGSQAFLQTYKFFWEIDPYSLYGI